MSEWIEKEVSISQIEALLENGYEVEVDSPDGWVGVDNFIHKGMYEEYKLEVEDGTIVRCNYAHLFETAAGWAPAERLVGEEFHILTKNGYRKATVKKTGYDIPIVDITVNHENHRYYTEDVSSHNTGVGKSLVMGHVSAAALMMGKNVLYITLELSEESVGQRMDANLLNLTMDEVVELPRDVYLKRIDRIKSKTPGKMVIRQFPTGSAGVNHFRFLLNELKVKNNFIPDLIVIDYINICASSRIKSMNNINSYSYIKAIAEEMRGLAIEVGVPIITATQTTRSGAANSDPELQDTSESFGLPATADFMCAIVSSEELEKLGQYMFKQLKNRWDNIYKNLRFVVGVDKARMKLYNCEQSAQDDIIDDPPVMDNSTFGQRWDDEEKDSTLPRKFNKKTLWNGFA